jgi:DNA-binding GntR family transcriptional regulator
MSGRRLPLKRPAPLREVVYEALIEMIISGELKPGQHLVENDLAVTLGVSRQPIREALLRLESESWVDLRPAQGAFVHVPTRDEVVHLFSVRTLLEAESARLAAKHATPEHVEELRKIQRVGEKAVEADDREALVAANFDLHAYMVSISGNTVLADMIAAVERRGRWYFSPLARMRKNHSWVEHAAIIDAISAGDSRRAQRLMRRHADQAKRGYLRIMSASNEPDAY